MPFDFASAKANARRVIHATLGVSAFIKVNSTSTPEPITARLHEASTVYGDLLNQGYAETVEAVDRIVFFPEDIAPEHRPRKLAEVTFPHRAGITFVLQTKDVSDGPSEEVWQVTRK